MNRRSFLLGIIGVMSTPLVAEATTPITVRGRLDASKSEAEQGRFTLNAEQLDQAIAIEVGTESYLQMYLDGCIGHDVTLTVTPT